MLTLNDGRSELWQWDTGRTLAVDADCSQVHFSNKVFGRSIDDDVAEGVAIIPDILLQTDNDLSVWAFVGTAENGYTKISKTFKVNRRNKPADYVFTPTDQITLQTIQSQIGDLADLTTEEKENLVAAINEAAASGGAGSMDLRVADGYIQYSTDSGSTWQNLIAVAELKGADGSKGDPGAPGKDGHSPVVTATKSGKTTTISVDGSDIAMVEDGADGAPGSRGADGITPHIGDNGNWYLGDTDTGKPSRGETGSGMGITGAAVGQIAKITDVDESGVPTAWAPVDLPGGGGDEWVKVAETTLTEIANEIRLNFDPCKAVYIEFQYGAVEGNLGVIGIYPNPQTPIYTSEKRTCAVYTTTSDKNKRGYIFCTIDRRKGTQWVATSQIFQRGDGAFGSIQPGSLMNCDIWVKNDNTWSSLLSKERLVGSDYINSVSAFGAGMNIGTTLTVWGIKA